MKAEPTKDDNKDDNIMNDDVMKQRFKRIEELQAFNKSEAGKAFFEKHKSPSTSDATETELIAEFWAFGNVPEVEKELFRCDVEAIEQAAINLKEKTKLQTASAIKELLEERADDLQYCTDEVEVLKILNEVFQKYEKKHLSETEVKLR